MSVRQRTQGPSGLLIRKLLVILRKPSGLRSEELLRHGWMQGSVWIILSSHLVDGRGGPLV